MSKKLASKIINKLKEREIRENKVYVPKKLEQLYAYYLTVNFDTILKDYDIDIDDIEITSIKDGFILSTNNDFSLTLSITNNGVVGPIYKAFKDGKTIFSITDIENVVINKIYDEEKTIEYRYYENSNNFYYFTALGHAEKSDEYTYGGELRAVNAKVRNNEILEYKRIIPKDERVLSFFQRIYENMINESCVYVATDDLSDLVEYADQIYDKLKEAEAKYRIKHPNKALIKK